MLKYVALTGLIKWWTSWLFIHRLQYFDLFNLFWSLNHEMPAHARLSIHQCTLTGNPPRIQKVFIYSFMHWVVSNWSYLYIIQFLINLSSDMTKSGLILVDQTFCSQNKNISSELLIELRLEVSHFSVRTHLFRSYHFYQFWKCQIFYHVSSFEFWNVTTSPQHKHDECSCHRGDPTTDGLRGLNVALFICWRKLHSFMSENMVQWWVKASESVKRS